MTQRTFERLTNVQQTHAYLDHELNQGSRGKNGRTGPSVVAQAAFLNDWRKAFFDFSARLGSSNR